MRKAIFALSQINELILTENDELELFRKLANLIVDKIGYTECIVGKVDEETKLIDKLFIRAKLKEAEKLTKKHLIGVDPEKPYGRGSASKAYQSKKVILIPEVKTNPNMAYWNEFYINFNIHSACSIPIIKNERVEYIIILLDTTPYAFDENHMELLERLQLNLSFALEKIQNQKDMALFNEALEKTHEWAIITNRDGVILKANKAVSDISGYSRNELLGKKPNIFKSGYHDKKFYENLWNTILSGKTFSAKFTNKTKNGSIFYLDSLITPILHNGEVYRFVDLSRNITKEVIYSERLKFQSSLYNILFHLTNISTQIKSKREYLKKLTKLFVKFAQINISFMIKVHNNKIIITNTTAKNRKYKDMTKKLQVIINNNPLLAIPALKTLKNGRVYIQNNAMDEKLKPISEIATIYGIGSCCSIPIKEKGKTEAALVLVSTQKNIFDKKLFELVNTVAKQIEVTLGKIDKERFLNIVLTAINIGFEFVFIVDKNLKFVYINDSLKKVSGYSNKDVINKSLIDFLVKDEDKDSIKNLITKLKTGESISKAITYRKKDGKLESFLATITPHKENDSVEYFIGVGKQITPENDLLNELNKLLHYDSLTGLLNSKAFVESIEKFLIRAKKEELIGAIAVINPLSFKNINEAFGFETGNQILTQVAQRLKSATFNYDIVAKLESDRFGIILKDLKKEEDSLIALERILKELAKPYRINNSNIILSFNIGLSLYPKDGTSTKELLNKAQIALADARSRGEDRIGFFRKNFETKATKLIKLKAELESALHNNEFKPYYQPCVDRNGLIMGAEALIRWIKNDKIIPPSEFISQLEQSELIIKVEDKFIESVVSFISQTKKEGIPPYPIAINLSIKSLNSKDLFERVILKIKQNKIDTRYLKFEIVERAFLEKFEHLNKLILRFREKGISFSVDDFGTGYSSLSYLAKLPVDFLKIDMSFIRALSDEKTRNIVRSIIFLAKELNIQTIAEGVETKEQFDILKEMGCSCFQGYLFYRPMPESDFKSLLMERKNGQIR
ncbi:EAL domain-containing protein [Hippea maritima]|uniref:Diguanylate cyclase/phosphodiesterase with PAS/PAC and GAF sensor(S) n=1 Tax=Hippea maritima (strain ATCC 700847 / DSM 10411 / MH2) TaxID=760142 RepID=F2LUD6_HIPMA|nr:diguanylate cyclase/phosphodiesterase with PAS/PAC and GAF sensor(s) [Hippea maritima DSM 10411]